jgi:hypothetical protein
LNVLGEGCGSTLIPSSCKCLNNHRSQNLARFCTAVDGTYLASHTNFGQNLEEDSGTTALMTIQGWLGMRVWLTNQKHHFDSRQFLLLVFIFQPPPQVSRGCQHLIFWGDVKLIGSM